MTSNITKLIEDIERLEQLKASGILPKDLANTSILALKIQLDQKKARLAGNGAIAQGDNTVAVGQDGLYVGGDFHGNVYMGDDPEEDDKRLAIYRRWVIQSTASLPLRGVDVGASDPSSEQKTMGLANVYIDLDTTTRDDGSIEIRDSLGERDQFSNPQIEKAVSVLNATAKHRHFVLLGEPGCGKSTFVNFLAECLAAHPLEPEKHWNNHLRGWQPNEFDILPIVVILRDFARSFAKKLPNEATPSHLLEFINSRLRSQNLSFALPILENALETGNAIVLLDGMDEVPTHLQRVFVRDAVRAFLRRYEKSRFLVTCRILSYQAPELRLNELPSFEIAPFNQGKIDRFVSAWYTELGHLGNVPASDVPILTERLREAVRRTDLQRLAPNPLLLTVMSLVHTHRGRLPDARALLYEETVDILLWRWEQIKLSGQEDTPRLRQYLLEAGRTDVDLKRVLWQLAYDAHAASKPDNSGEALADISEHRILKTLAALKCDEKNPDGDLNWAKWLVDLIKVRAGLLLERQPEIFTFPHRTFEEYLAGAHLATQSNFSELASKLAYRNIALWRETILYAAGKLVYVNGDVSKPLTLVAELCPNDANENEVAWKLAWLAGEVLQEIGLKRVNDSALGRDLLTRTINRLSEIIYLGKLTFKERIQIRNVLKSLGYSLFDPNHWYLPSDSTFGFVQILEGEFAMGSDLNIDKKAYSDEIPLHKVMLPEYWIAKYPVTIGQFRCFVEETGYDYLEPNILHDFDDNPIRWVTWYDALAFCNWLNEKLINWATLTLANNNQQIEKKLLSLMLDIREGHLQVMLPSEAEWEKAARGTDGGIYPWGNDFDSNKTNTKESGIDTTVPVFCFPNGASKYSVLDMSGSVWEWTRSLWGLEKDKPDFIYPYVATDGREDLSVSNNFFRILRGGSFDYTADYARCAFRSKNKPDTRFRLYGFRIVLTPYLTKSPSHVSET